jgi:hypothetical protein
MKMVIVVNMATYNAIKESAFDLMKKNGRCQGIQCDLCPVFWQNGKKFLTVQQIKYCLSNPEEVCGVAADFIINNSESDTKGGVI